MTVIRLDVVRKAAKRRKRKPRVKKPTLQQRLIRMIHPPIDVALFEEHNNDNGSKAS